MALPITSVEPRTRTNTFGRSEAVATTRHLSCHHRALAFSSALATPVLKEQHGRAARGARSLGSGVGSWSMWTRVRRLDACESLWNVPRARK